MKHLAIFLLFALPACAQFKPAPGFQPTSPQPQPAAQTTTATATVAPKPATGAARDISVPGEKQWTDTGIDVHAGDKLTFTSEGTLQFGGRLAATSDGLARGWRDLMRALPVNSAGNAALIGRIGAAEVATPFLIGKSREIVAPVDGRLYLGVNQLATESSQGAYIAHVVIAAASAAAPTTSTAQAKVTLDLLKDIPRRVEDQAGNKGDIVNFSILGSKEQLENAFQQAGWVLVDRTKGAAVVNALFSTLDRKAYLQMPMSELYMFGRPQDYGYAHAEPIEVVASRHHLRIWLSESTYDDKPVYVGSCTHDIGFERDQRNQGVTHKIDPNIDLERDFLKDSLSSTGLVRASTYLEPTDAVKDAKTATGGQIKTDGRILVLLLK